MFKNTESKKFQTLNNLLITYKIMLIPAVSPSSGKNKHLKLTIK